MPFPPDDFELVVVNPASMGARGGIRVLQLLRPGLQGRIRCRLQGSVGVVGEGALTWVLETRNIRRFALQRVKGSLAAHPASLAAGFHALNSLPPARNSKPCTLNPEP